MSAIHALGPRRQKLQGPLALKLALRELRTGLSGFYVFVACIALGVAAIAGVGSLAGVLQESLAAQGQRILGGDFSARLVHRQANPDERAFLVQQGELSEVATMRAMARSMDGEYSSLIDVTAVDGAYPLYGELVITGKAGALGPNDLRRPGVAAADAGLLTRFDIALGETVKIGAASVQIIATIDNQPDRLSGRPALGPRVLLSSETLRSTGLVQPGSLIRWWYRVRFQDTFAGGADRLKALRKDIAERFPNSGFSLRDRTEPAPNVARAIERFSQFLTLVGVTTLMIGGLGVANAIATYLVRKRDVIAAFKCLGASRATIFATYLIQVLALAGVGTTVGLALGAAMPPLIAWAYGDVLPLELALGVQPLALAMASLYGLLTALLFVLWPLGRARDLPAARLLRDSVTSERARPSTGFVAAAALCALALAAIAILSAYAKLLALYACLALAFCFAVYLALGWALQRGARALKSPGRVELALARAGLAAPGGLARPVALSLGTGLTLLSAVSLVNAALISEFRTSLPNKAPSYYVLDIDKTQIDPLRGLIDRQAPAIGIATAPILRGRIVNLRGIAADEIEAPEGVRWVLNGDRGLTFADRKPEEASLVEGDWWPADYAGPPLVSVAAEIGKQVGPAPRRQGHRQCAWTPGRSDGRQFSHRRLGFACHQLRVGLFAQRPRHRAIQDPRDPRRAGRHIADRGGAFDPSGRQGFPQPDDDPRPGRD